MNVYQIIELLFATIQGSIEEQSLINQLAEASGKSIASIKSAINGCRNKKNKTDFSLCIRKKLKLGGPGLPK
ncbi:hypothetical protein Rhein_3016 [Rheinheimera sp. A13L]|uniref:hypothetical protein n=1 Tax=Rheinheimera sp. A13L TaxID=506534 RepID=UPI0002125363|nr:hypothetical protein [Rheinheimera sp. A13L]EGM76779.1 hypothetical protein Rhein_3016 [Rheinheimera sp. A13L]